MSNSDAVYLEPLYPTVTTKLLRRLKDMPWQMSRTFNAAFETQFWSDFKTVREYTMVSYAGLRALQKAIRHVVARGIPGDVVECGVAQGGSAVVMGLALKRIDQGRRLWLFDTFEGIPAPTSGDPDLHLAVGYTGQFRGSISEVKHRLDEIGIVDRSTLVKGRFQDTLASSEVQQIAVMHLDGDWYDGMSACLEAFFDRVSPDGIIQIDDYGTWAGTRKAVDEFVRKRSLQLHYVDHACRQIIKPDCG